jgi:hypothetical protein
MIGVVPNSVIKIGRIKRLRSKPKRFEEENDKDVFQFLERINKSANEDIQKYSFLDTLRLDQKKSKGMNNYVKKI